MYEKLSVLTYALFFDNICHVFSLSTPTFETDQDGTLNMNRRSSSGGLLSPEVDIGPGAKGMGSLGLGEASEQDGFYLLKKDSQRRMTLSRVISQDEQKICEVWMGSIHRDLGVTVLSMVQLIELKYYLC